VSKISTYEMISLSVSGNKLHLEALINKFNPLLKKHAHYLDYEDAYSDMVLWFIVEIKNIKPHTIKNQNEASMLSYINMLVKNISSKLLSLKIDTINSKPISSFDYDENGGNIITDQYGTLDNYEELGYSGLLQILSKNEADVIYSYFYLDCTEKEIAKKLFINRGSVARIKSRAIRKLRESLL
jgi:DNA-directed RNA polymerase specialized sigma subunit